MEQIYTIPVNEAFEASAADKSCGCPFCSLYNKLENDELDLILGASMMEPDVRIKTNKAPGLFFMPSPMSPCRKTGI